MSVDRSDFKDHFGHVKTLKTEYETRVEWEVPLLSGGFFFGDFHCDFSSATFTTILYDRMAQSCKDCDGTGAPYRYGLDLAFRYMVDGIYKTHAVQPVPWVDSLAKAYEANFNMGAMSEDDYYRYKMGLGDPLWPEVE